ncbi:MAG: hypothetical protein V4615_15390 [Bacteroidota bacterium]
MIIRFTKIFFAFIFILTVSSCERKNCTNVVCPAGQSCANGQCVCDNGYEGSDCQTLSYLKYTQLNSFTSEQCNTVPPFSTSNVYITWDGTYAYQIRIHNLMGSNCFDVLANIYTDSNNEGNQIQIPEQSCGGSSVSGQGTYDKVNRRLTLELYYNAGGTPYTCTTYIQ